MIWLASFPRSGNTFVRNVLYYCYGLKSSTYDTDPRRTDTGWRDYPFVKTHVLPSEVPHASPAVYLVRDGRDALVSIAWHRSNIVAPGTDFLTNLFEAVRAEQGSFFGGWSENVRRWTREAQLVIRFEELVKEPVKVLTRMHQVFDLPEPDWSKLPTFQSQKSGQPEYGSGKYVVEGERVEDFANKNFRRGESGSWKEEMPIEVQDIFWERHGEMMERLGYTYDGTFDPPHEDLERDIHRKMFPGYGEKPPLRVLIEASKLVLAAHDGVKRYLTGLLTGLRPIAADSNSRWHIELLVDGRAIPFSRYIKHGLEPRQTRPEQQPKEAELPRISQQGQLLRYEQRLLSLKSKLKSRLPANIYGTLASIYRFLPIRPLLRLSRKAAKSASRMWKKLKPSPDPFARFDLIHMPLQQHFELFEKTRKPLVITVHDVTYRLHPEYHEARNVELCEAGMRFSRKHRSWFIAVSEATKRDVTRLHKIAASRIAVTHEATDRALFVIPKREIYIQLVRKKYGIPPGVPYLLCLSTIEPRKNLDNVVAAFSKLVAKNPGEDLHLVVAGKFGWKTEHLSDLKLPRIHFTGFVEDRHLAVIYSQALGLCYVSFYEGFGLPPLEAMTCRTPVIYGNNSSMPEVIGDGGLPADPSDVDDIMEKMERIYRNPGLREQLALNAWRRSFNFSWRRMAAETLAAYEGAMRSKR